MTLKWSLLFPLFAVKLLSIDIRIFFKQYLEAEVEEEEGLELCAEDEDNWLPDKLHS